MYLREDTQADIIKQINELPATYDNKIVFVSRNHSLIADAVGPKATGFILETELKERLPAMMDTLAIHPLIPFKTTQGIVSIALPEIIYIDFSSRWATLHTCSMKHDLTNETLKSIYDSLPSNRFFMINRSQVINISWISSLENDMVCLGNTPMHTLHVSRRRMQELKGILS